MSANYQLLDTLFEAAVIIGEKGEVQYFNHYFTVMTKSSPRVIRKNPALKDLIQLQDFKLSDLLSSAASTQSPQLSEELHVLSPNDGPTTDVVIKISPIEENRFLVLFNDISIEKRLYNKYKQQLQELQDTHSQIVQADKLSTIGELTANISHEISNPLTIATGNLEIIESLLQDDDFVNEKELIETSVKDVQESHERIQNIISNMKTFLHKEEGEKEYCDLKEIAEETLKFMSPKLEDNDIVAEVNVHNNDVMALGNKIKIEQVFINLVKNAIDSINESKNKKKQIAFDIGKNPENNMVYFEVSDTGVGIDKSKENEIFNAFYTTKGIGEGTGLGLAISHRIMESHKGSLQLKKSDESGAIFRGELPNIEILSFTQNEILKNPRQTGDSQKPRVLVVDDEVQILNVLNKMISDEGFVFIGSANPYDALKMIDEIPIDLILVDYHMPEMKGDEFVKKVRENYKALPIMYISSPQTHDEFLKDKEQLKLSGMILKPFNKEDVIKTIKASLNLKEEEV